MASPKKQFNIMLERTQLEHLQEIADGIGANKAHAFRMVLTHAHKHMIQGIPCCADGRPCFVAHLHPEPAKQTP